jgi:hypothetical protein
VLFYVVIKPDKTPVESPFLDMKSAQDEIERIEPDITLRSQYQIHPISQLSDLRQLSVRPCEKITIEKFNGEYVGQVAVEVIEFTT